MNLNEKYQYPCMAKGKEKLQIIRTLLKFWNWNVNGKIYVNCCHTD